MPTWDNRIAGQSLERLAALSGGIFARHDHIAFLAAISLMPFSTALLAQFIMYRVALVLS